MSSPATPPVVVLVRPQLGQNIGAVARAMLNFGLSDLRLVQPRDGWPNADAGPSAAGADVVLDGARVFDTLADAVADCHWVVATAMSTRDMIRQVWRPDAAALQMRSCPGPSAMVFGPERTGLEQHDLLACHGICTIPSNPDFGSLNLAQAVAVLGYAWVMSDAPVPAQWLVNHAAPATHAEVQGLIAAIDVRLTANGYYNPVPGRAAAARRMLINLMTRPGFSGVEVQALRGIVRGLIAPRKPGSHAD
ncbi:MAG: RNA methyltransferase [Sphingomonadales bacterium]|jgi:tRNA/rRNA methyltransferase